ncbi:hypothetical protein C8035_v007093 [Colletotrichum spinosum]|uniref:Uncharacterized protein n=1 Tax=Colletotrichum spinosum TaxID=1347390 RepID=A0A4R8QDF5_9PEZI|nr:hypothetical protein C8035_v007093 [Colletotrichum spinosum]
MRFPQMLLSLFLLFSFVVALPVPAPADALVERANNKGGGGKGGNAKTSKEVKGIDKNISIQKQEKKDAARVSKAEGTKNFGKEKARLNKTIDKGVDQRKKNQANADPKNKQLKDGLNKVQKAQGTEKKQAQGLNGGKGDKKTLDKLQKEFSGGIKQNEKNKNAAKKGGK